MHDRYEFRYILPYEGEQAAEIEQICFPPNEACTPERMQQRVSHIPEQFLVAVDRRTNRLAGFLKGLAPDEGLFRDAFFLDVGLHVQEGKNIMLLGLDVLPEHRGKGLATEIMRQYVQREQARGRHMLLLTCLEEKVSMYQGMGYEDLGLADSAWGGEAWHEMRYRLI